MTLSTTLRSSAVATGAYAHDELELIHTVVGGVLNAAAMFMWSAVHELLFARQKSLVNALASGAAVSALAYVVDYHVVPKRFTRGSSPRLPRRGMAAMYVALGLSLAARGLQAQR